jgi:predicted DNA-binding transcriptional regulator AlpA
MALAITLGPFLFGPAPTEGESMPTRKPRARASENPSVAPDQPWSRPISASRLRQVQQRVPLSRSAIYAGMAEGWFPKPFKAGRSNLWVDSEIDDFIHQRMLARKAS